MQSPRPALLLLLVACFQLPCCDSPTTAPPLDARLEARADLGSPDLRPPSREAAVPDLLAVDAELPEQPPVWILHISDSHIGVSSYATQALTKAIAEVLPAVSPLATIHSGDSTDFGALPEWTSYRAIIDGKVPAFPLYFEVPGNHDKKSDDGKNYLAQSQSGKATSGFFGISYVDPPPGRVRLVRTDTADTPLYPRATMGYFGEGQRDTLYKIPASTVPVKSTVVIGHHPLKGVQGLEVLGTAGRMEELLQHFSAAVYLCGHAHASALSWSNDTLVVQAPSLGKPESLTPETGFSLVAVGPNGPSARIISLAKPTPAVSWPLVLVTSPADLKLGGTNPHAKPIARGAQLQVRALAFSPTGIQSAEVRFGEGAWSSMSSADKRLWQLSLSTPQQAGQTTLEVRARSTEGTNSHAVTISVAP